MGQRHRYTSIPEGKFNDLILSLDLIDAGMAGWLQRLTPERQQVMFAVLSKAAADLLRPRRESDPETPLLPDALIHLRPLTAQMRRDTSRNLIITHFDSCPDGFLGALSKTGTGPQNGAYYVRLHCILADPAQKRLAKVLRQSQTLDVNRLNVLVTLDPIFHSVTFAEKVKTTQQATDLNAALQVIRKVVGEHAPDTAIRASVEDTGLRMSLRDWLASWLRCAVSLPCPALDLGEDWRVLDTGERLTEVGLRYRVCLRDPDRIIAALSGRFSHYENRRLGAIAEVQAVGPQRHLILVGVHSSQNRRVPRDVRERVYADFLRAGVPHMNWTPEATQWDALHRLVCPGYEGEGQPGELSALETLEAA